jgi:hypothetical protein
MLSAVLDKRAAEKIKSVVKGTLNRGFEKVGNMRIVSVYVDEDMDRDGERVLKIYVVFDGVPKARDVNIMSGAVGQIRPKLAKIGETAFPLISYISKAEAGAARLGTW